MNNLTTFIEMGGHGLYIWSAYGITAVVFAYNIVRPILMRKEIISAQRRLLQQQAKPAGKENS